MKDSGTVAGPELALAVLMESHRWAHMLVGLGLLWFAPAGGTELTVLHSSRLVPSTDQVGLSGKDLNSAASQELGLPLALAVGLSPLPSFAASGSGPLSEIARLDDALAAFTSYRGPVHPFQAKVLKALIRQLTKTGGMAAERRTEDLSEYGWIDAAIANYDDGTNVKAYEVPTGHDTRTVHVFVHPVFANHHLHLKGEKKGGALQNLSVGTTLFTPALADFVRKEAFNVHTIRDPSSPTSMRVRTNRQIQFLPRTSPKR